MKNLGKIIFIFLLGLFVISACNNDDDNQDNGLVDIEEVSPFYMETIKLQGVDKDLLELFNYKVVAINSIEELENYPLLNYLPEEVIEKFLLFDFEKYTLMLTSSFSINKVNDIEYTLIKKEVGILDYTYFQTLYCDTTPKIVENIHLVGVSFSTAKLPAESKFTFISGSLISEKTSR